MRYILIPLALCTALAAAEPDASGTLRLTLRSKVESFKGSGEFDEVTFRKDFVANETAVILCDIWDKHWCESATKRCDALAKKAKPVVAKLRDRGVTIIHAPSDTMAFYKDAPQRKAMLRVPKVAPPKNRTISEPALPIDDSDGGCDDDPPAKFSRAWTRQHPAITVAEGDFVSDNGQEVYNLLAERRIKNLLVMGVHTNMCVLNRTFAIKQMTRWGIRCVLVRDLTDAMYNPKKRPHVSHDEGTALVIGHIEKWWCPTCKAGDLK